MAILVRFFDSPHPLVFAHRGGMALGPENTIPAFDAGRAAGADGIELDVHLSADGVVVVHHDRTLERTTNATGPIASKTAGELARVDAAWHFAVNGMQPLRGQGAGIPTLREVLQRYRDMRLIVEMKADLDELGDAVVRTVREADAVDRVCLCGFGSRPVLAVRRAMKEVATGACQEEVRRALRRTWLRWPVRDCPYQGYQIPERAGRLRVVSPRFVRYAHQAGLKVQVWTVDVEEDMTRLLDWGVDALISNRPEQAVRVRNTWASTSDRVMP